MNRGVHAGTTFAAGSLVWSERECWQVLYEDDPMIHLRSGNYRRWVASSLVRSVRGGDMVLLQSGEVAELATPLEVYGTEFRLVDTPRLGGFVRWSEVMLSSRAPATTAAKVAAARPANFLTVDRRPGYELIQHAITGDRRWLTTTEASGDIAHHFYGQVATFLPPGYK